MSNATDRSRPITGRAVLIIFVSFFAIVVSVNMLMMKFAIETLSGTDVDSAYRASLAYDSEIHAARDQAARHWRVDAYIERSVDGEAMLRIEVRDAMGAPLNGLNFSSRLERPADKRADRTVVLANVGGGVYRGHILGVLSGQWDFVIEGEDAGRRMFLSKNRVVLN